MTEKFREDFENDDLCEIEQLLSRSVELERQASAARTRMFLALNMALVALIGQGLTGNWEMLAVTLASALLMGVGADYYIEERLWTFSFFKDSWRCLTRGWKVRLHPKSAGH